ncbi:HesA/MoeB/ThiF family protein [Halovivax limisalsi]|uniref:HesA/MoeB/ThiF family protein n=1 Tax=Halovivax limisalsi TaxID=1453760 RepID=UPI001FFCB618|nr:molybdopterin-synthase adenylyltransferase MoeB [Halovivax limisalsi]
MADLSLDATQLDRYSRHVIMDEVGPEGQAALLDGSVLVVGAGGLGSPAIQYLAAAGVGRLGIVDDDVVERSNLQRQIVHADADVGRPKVASAADYVERLNPDVAVEPYETRLDADSIDEIAAGYDVVCDASDNFATRYLCNDYCTLTDTPLSHGAIYRFEGQVTTIDPAGAAATETESTASSGSSATDSTGEGAAAGDSGAAGPCYRCLFPEAPEPGTVPDCATTGVLGVLPGTIGCIQATEVVKLLTGIGETLAGRLLVYDASGMSVETVDVRRDPDCPVCGEEPAVESVDDVSYGARCAIRTE